MSIPNDFTIKDQKEQKLLKKYLKLTNTQNHNARITCKKLAIDGSLYIIKKIEERIKNEEDNDEYENSRIDQATHRDFQAGSSSNN